MSHRNGRHGENDRFDDQEGSPRKRRRKGRDDGEINGHRHHEHDDDAPADTGGKGDDANAKGRLGLGGVSNRRNLSEISHLFLSDIRGLNDHGRTPPRRIPPGGLPDRAAEPDDRLMRREETIDLTPEEFDGGAPPEEEEGEMSIPPVSAVIGARLGGTLIRRACQYASGLASELPVGLLVVEATEVRLMWVAQGEDPDTGDEAPESFDDPHRLRAALLEMSCDIAQWLVVIPDPRLPHARRLLAGLREWVLLAPASHDGVVASYRVLKGLCDLELPDDEAQAPRVTLALVDAADAGEAQRHARKLVGVCKQFLDLDIAAAPMEAGEPAAGAVSNVQSFTAREVVCAGWPDADAAAGAWEVVAELLLPGGAGKRAAQRRFMQEDPIPEPDMFQEPRPTNGASGIPDSAIPPMARPAPRSADDAWAPTERRRETRQPVALAPDEEEPVRRRLIDDIEVPDLALPLSRPSHRAEPVTSSATATAPVAAAATVGPKLASTQASAEPMPHRRAVADVDLRPVFTQPALRARDEDEVIELPAGGSVADVVLSRLEVVMTPVYPPMLPAARLCVSRDGGVVLVAAAAPGLTDLGLIGRAMTWATENRLLLRMALSQYRLDDAADVSLHLLVSHADVNADALRPLMTTGRVTVQTYRRLTWGGRSGLLLEAA